MAAESVLWPVKSSGHCKMFFCIPPTSCDSPSHVIPPPMCPMIMWLQFFLIASPENLWGSRYGWLPAAATCQEGFFSSLWAGWNCCLLRVIELLQWSKEMELRSWWFKLYSSTPSKKFPSACREKLTSSHRVQKQSSNLHLTERTPMYRRELTSLGRQLFQPTPGYRNWNPSTIFSSWAE